MATETLGITVNEQEVEKSLHRKSLSTKVAANGHHHNKDPYARKDRAGLKGKRGEPKKGGGGGNYTWGKPGDELNADYAIRRGDPNYDSQDDDEKIILVSEEEQMERQALRSGIEVRRGSSGRRFSDALYTENAGYDPYSAPDRSGRAPKVSLSEFKQRVLKIAEEYFVSEDMNEFLTAVKELDSPMLHYDLVRRIIPLAMARGERERELVSKVLSEMRGHGLLPIEQCGKGFERLFEIADDLVLDIPMARKYLAQFLARAVADELLPPAFLSDPLIEGMGSEIVEQAKVLLSIKHGLVRLEKVWGTSSLSSVEELKEEIKLILEEFLTSSDMDEVCECLKRLHVPHFHHEVIKRAIVLAMDKKDRERAMMSSLLAELHNREIVSQQQIQLGFERLYEVLNDLELDTPGASKILDIFANQAISDGCLNSAQLEAAKVKTARMAAAPEMMPQDNRIPISL